MTSRYRHAVGAIAVAILLVVGHFAQAGDAAQIAAEKPFLTDNDAAMAKMMAGMEPHPTGNIDTDFVHMMVPHHQGAIDMALLELRYGHNPILLRLAQEIIVDQQQQIVAMHLAIGEKLPPSTPAPTAVGSPAPMQMK